jgi:hypothetical protein
MRVVHKFSANSQQPTANSQQPTANSQLELLKETVLIFTSVKTENL